LLLGHCVVAEAACNWYLLDINIYSLSKKKPKKRSRKLFSNGSFESSRVDSFIVGFF
jgi:hypothetical protein